MQNKKTIKKQNSARRDLRKIELRLDTNEQKERKDGKQTIKKGERSKALKVKDK